MTTSPRIVIVDDFPDTAELLGNLLTRVGGYETRTATNGLEGIRIVEEFRPEFVLLDIGMPNLNGFDTAKRIRREAWGRAMALIAMSAQWNEEYGRWALEAGFDGYLLKPMLVMSIVDLIQKFSHSHCKGTDN